MNEPSQSVSKLTIASGHSLAVCSLANALLVIAKETSPPVQAEMQRLTGHHWITHVVIVLALFAFGTFSSARVNGGRGFSIPANRLIKWVVGSVVMAALVIIGFYALAD